MKKTLSILLAFIMVLLVSCHEEKKPPVQTSEPIINMIYTKDKYADAFFDPSSEYRLRNIIHDFTNRDAASWVSSFGAYLVDGRGGVVTNIPFDNGYVDNEKHFENLNFFGTFAKKYGMSFWLYDEQGYPSGSAGGRVTFDNPEYTAWGLTVITRTGKGMSPISVNRNEALISFKYAYAIDENGKKHDAIVNDNSVTFNGTDGEWTLYVFASKKLYEGTHAEQNSYQGYEWLTRDYPNLLDKNAVAKFINVTYKQYAEKFEYFKDAVGVFTDEPSLMEIYLNTGDKVFEYAQVSWVEGLEKRFEEMHGYKIQDNLHHLFEGTSYEAKITRVNYRQTVGTLFAENYFKQLSDFCKDNGTYSGGHLFNEESINGHAYNYGDALQCLKEMDIPGADILYANDKDYMNKGWSTFLAVKMASSAARLTGKNRVMAELCTVGFDSGVFSDEEKKQIWATTNLALFQGVNDINGYINVEKMLKDKTEYLNYIARLSYISSQAKWNSEIGLYYPINTAQAYSSAKNDNKLGTPDKLYMFNEMGLELFRRQLDYCIVDNEFILDAEIVNGSLVTENLSISYVCMPGVEVMPYEVLKKLNEFEKSGGKVYYVGMTPYLPDNINDIEKFKELASEIKHTSVTNTAIKMGKECAYALEVKNATKNVYVGKYLLEDADMYWVFNYTANHKMLNIEHKGAKGFDIYDPMTGEVTSMDGEEIKLKFDGYAAKILIVKK